MSSAERLIAMYENDILEYYEELEDLKKLEEYIISRIEIKKQYIEELKEEC